MKRFNTIYKNQNQAFTELDDFKILKVLGRGSFGKVYLVQSAENDQLYAMKALRKDLLLAQNLVEATLQEKKVLINS